MKQSIIAVALLFVLVWRPCMNLAAQESDPPQHDNFWHRVSVGGNVGFQFGDVTDIVVSPDARIRIVDQLYGGLGFTYQYIRFKNYFYDKPNQDYIDFKSNAYGGSIFFRYYLKDLFDNFLGNVFVHAEYEYLDFIQPVKMDPTGPIYDPYNNQFSPGHQHIEFNSLFVGAGYSQPLGGKAFLDLLLLFNLNDTYNSPYSNPVFRLGFGIGL